MLFIAILVVAAVVTLILESRGAPVVLTLTFKGDVKRETRWLAQYGQGACTLVAGLLVWRLDAAGVGLRRAFFLLAAVFGTSLVCTVIKRLAGRVRPNRENAGKFLGPTLKHANYRESFPSSHSAAAIAMSVYLAGLYPAAAPVFWGLGICCAALRYVMDAHWPSDVLAGVALGWAGALVVLRVM